METSSLDDRDRKNLYKPDADNVRVVEATVDEIRSFVGGSDFGEFEELETALDEAQGQVHSHNEDRSYVVIKVVR